jgi:hypothetical protein
MIKFRLFSAALLAAATVMTPAIARQHHATSRHVPQNAYAAAPDIGCVRAPRVGAFATQPWRKPPCEFGTTYGAY